MPCAVLLLALFGYAPAWAQITYRAVGTGTAASSAVAYRGAGAVATNSGGSITPGLPTGTVQGDLLVLIVLHSGDDSQIAAPSADWTLMRQGSGSQNISAAVFYRIAPTGATAPTVANPDGGSTLLMGRVIGFSGVNPASPIASSGISLNTNDDTTNAPQVAGSTVGTSMVVVTSHVNDDCDSTDSPSPGSWTQAFFSSTTTATDGTIAAHYRLQTGAGNQAAVELERDGNCDNDDAYGVQFVINGGSLVIPVPAGTIAGDVMIATLATRPSGSSFSAPSGWTSFADTTQTNDVTARMTSYWRVATASEPSSYTWGFSGSVSSGAVGTIASFSGVDNVTPINVFGTTATGSSLSHAAPSVTTTAANTMLVTSHMFTSVTSDWSVPAGMTEMADIASEARPSTLGLSMSEDYQTIAAAGATGARTAVASATGTNAGYGIARSVALKPEPPPVPLAEWRMDESTWTVSPYQVVDSVGSYNGVAAFANGSGPRPSTASTAPVAYSVTSTGQSTCRYGLFDSTASPTQTYTYVQLNSFPSLSSQFTFAGWIRTTDRTASGQRILVNDDKDDGWGFSVGDTTAGTVRFFNRKLTNSGAVTGNGVDGNCGVFCIDSSSVIANNTWYFVAVTVNTTTKDVTVYVFNTSGTRLDKTTGKYAGTWANGTGAVAIGGETSASSEGTQSGFHFKGNIDEVKVYGTALSENALKSELTRARSCTAPVNHIRILHDGEGLTCSPELVTVQACADANCLSLYSGSVTLNLAPGGAGITFTGSTTTAQVSRTTFGTATLDATDVNPGVISATRCFNGGTETCSMNFVDSGFLITVPPHAAETAQVISISAVKKADNSLACTPAFASVNKTLNLKCGYVNPAAGAVSGQVAVRINNTALNTGNAAGSACDASGANVSLSFDSTGTATPTLKYADVGQMSLVASYTGAGADAGLFMTGTSNFVAAPASFSFSNVTSGVIKAGDVFSAKVTALNTASNATPSFGMEATPGPESVKLELGTRVAPTGTNNCTDGPCDGTVTGDVGTWSSGAATASNLKYSEVGQITLKATLMSGNYLGSTLTATGTSATVGAFIPAYFNTAVVPGCSSLFTYSGQPFTVTATAKNMLDGTTVNYSNLSGCTVCSHEVTLSDADASPPADAGFSNNKVAATAFAKGEGKTTAVAYTFASKLTAPKGLPSATQPLKLRAKDANTSLTTPLPTGLAEGATKVRSGRLHLSNTFGSEKQNLPMLVRTEYWNGNVWVASSEDSCTELVPGNFYLSNALTSVSPLPSPIKITGGSANVILIAPTGTPPPTGSVDVAANLGIVGNDQSCLGAHGGTPGNLSWLRSANGNCAATYDRDPSARATFGIYTQRRILHTRELFF